MVRQRTLLWFMAASALAGCEATEDPGDPAPLSPDAALAQSIERKVNALAPEHDLQHYVRLYTRGAGGNVEATYLSAPRRGALEKWEGGQSYWVQSSDVPRVLDGGCSVINVRYHAPTKKLVSLHCNGVA
jgi:hypothetical protein